MDSLSKSGDVYALGAREVGRSPRRRTFGGSARRSAAASRCLPDCRELERLIDAEAAFYRLAQSTHEDSRAPSSDGGSHSGGKRKRGGFLGELFDWNSAHPPAG